MSHDFHDTDVSVATGFLVLVAAFIFVARLTRRPPYWEMYRAEMRRGYDESTGETVPELWEAKLGNERDEKELGSVRSYGDVEAKTRALEEEERLVDMEIGVTKWRVEGGWEEFG
ncbi:hypothetical protein BDY24DRAFT_411005 [Mrakia frigida]|uniref:uncharacterized protein n=1 Tax=Mrakia frigida TaxID=29902 RepID=UPI003FCC1048